MAEEAAVGKFHVVGDEEADVTIADSEHMILHNEAIGRLLRNMYRRIQGLEKKVKDMEAKEEKKPAKAVKSASKAESGGP
jgi:hypothetical protein